MTPIQEGASSTVRWKKSSRAPGGKRLQVRIPSKPSSSRKHLPISSHHDVLAISRQMETSAESPVAASFLHRANICRKPEGKRLQVPYPERAFSVRKHLPTSSSHHAYSIPRPGGKRLQGFRIPSEFSPSRKHLPLPLRYRPRDSRPDGDRRSGWHARGGGNSRTLHRWEDLGVTLHPPWVIQFSKNDAPF